MELLIAIFYESCKRLLHSLIIGYLIFKLYYCRFFSVLASFWKYYFCIASSFGQINKKKTWPNMHFSALFIAALAVTAFPIPAMHVWFNPAMTANRRALEFLDDLVSFEANNHMFKGLVAVAAFNILMMPPSKTPEMVEADLRNRRAKVKIAVPVCVNRLLTVDCS